MSSPNFGRDFRFLGEEGRYERCLFLVENEVETLATVEGEAGVGGDEGYAEGDGVGDDDVVGGVFVVHGGV